MLVHAIHLVQAAAVAYVVWLAVLIKWLRPGVLGMGLSLVRAQAAEPCFRSMVAGWVCFAVPIKWLRPGVLGMGLSLVRPQAAGPRSRSRVWGSWRRDGAPSTALAPAHDGAVLCAWSRIIQLLVSFALCVLPLLYRWMLARACWRLDAARCQMMANSWGSM